MQNIFIELLPPWVETGLQPAFYDKESGTVLQQVSRMWSKMIELVKAFNDFSEDTADTVNEYIEKFTELHDYVHDYFDNLDVQEEINNKLDQMAEDGTLAEILEHYVIDDEFSTTSEKAVQNKVITNKINQIDDSLVFDDYIPIEFEEVIYESEANSTHTHSYVSYAIIDKQYQPEIVLADPNNVNARVLASNVAEREKATILTNAGLWSSDTSTTNGVLIIDHVTKQANNINDAERDFLCIADNGILSTVPANMTTAQVEGLGFKYVVAGWYKLYENGVDYSTSHDVTVLNPRTFIAQDNQGNYLVGACGGRSEFDTGMTLVNVVDFIRNTLNFNAVFIYNLDGGGSSQLYNRGLRENRKTNREDRACANYLVFRSSDAKTDVLFKSSKVVNDVIQRMNKYNLQTYYENYGTLKNHCHANITINAVSQVRVKNNMAYLNIVFSVNESGVSGYETLFTGMPKYYSNAGLWFPCIFLGNTVDNTKIYNCYLTQNGEINTRFALPQGQYSINLSYILPF